MSQGWQLIASKLDMDIPGQINKYLGCDRVQQKKVVLSTDDHPFAYLFDKSLPDPAATKRRRGAQDTRFLGSRAIKRILYQAPLPTIPDDDVIHE